MARILDTLKNEEPGIYWTAVDLAGRGKSAAFIKREIRWMIETANGKRAAQGRRLVEVSV